MWTLSHTHGWDRTGHMWKCGAFAIPKSLMLTGQQKHRRMLFQHTLAWTHPHLSHPPQWKGRNRFLPCGVSELLRQTEQELTTGRGLHAHNAQMGPWTLRHLSLLCSYIHIPWNTMSESIRIGTRFKTAPHLICDTYFCKPYCPQTGQWKPEWPDKTQVYVILKQQIWSGLSGVSRLHAYTDLCPHLHMTETSKNDPSLTSKTPWNMSYAGWVPLQLMASLNSNMTHCWGNMTSC